MWLLPQDSRRRETDSRQPDSESREPLLDKTLPAPVGRRVRRTRMRKGGHTQIQSRQGLPGSLLGKAAQTEHPGGPERLCGAPERPVASVQKGLAAAGRQLALGTPATLS